MKNSLYGQLIAFHRVKDRILKRAISDPDVQKLLIAATWIAGYVEGIDEPETKEPPKEEGETWKIT